MSDADHSTTSLIDDHGADTRSLRGDVLDEIGPERFHRWFSAVTVLSREKGELVLGVPSLFVQEWIERCFLPALERIARLRFGAGRVLLRIEKKGRSLPPRTGEIGGEPHPSSPSAGASSAREVRTEPQADRPSREASPPDRELPRARPAPCCRTPSGGGGDDGVPPGLNERLTLESFVVGDCNNVAYQAAMAVLRRPGAAYNPLFVYGGSGLGKTHLLQGITRVFFRQGERQIRYLPCETYTNRFIRTLRDRSIERFRETFHALRVLVLDDVHVLEGKPQTQLELLHTIDSIASHGGQVILASDSCPHAIQTLQKQLQGRFIAGLVCRMEAPDLPTRLAILRNEARRAALQVPVEVLRELAGAFTRNVRELIGAFVRVTAFASLMGEPLTETLTRSILEEQVWSGRKGVTLDSIVELIGRRYGVPPEEMRSRSRARSVCGARQVAIYLARVLTEHSLAEIGAYFGGRNHATASFSFRKIAERLQGDAGFQREMELLIDRLQE